MVDNDLDISDLSASKMAMLMDLASKSIEGPKIQTIRTGSIRASASVNRSRRMCLVSLVAIVNALLKLNVLMD